MVARVLLPTTSARIFYISIRKRRRGMERGFVVRNAEEGSECEAVWTIRTVDGPTRKYGYWLCRRSVTIRPST
jgi:hypothetical protein